ncbi:MAG: T9SS type A sorting domain-containing protein [Aliifodinibius sp.]|nr:T9SS type A sorting domain-containing protein [candidate division Zixibacteria bacterium]NIT61313.1 T9SS type A sorting domain-containing protein [Fodinibius sp.]NIW42648.1 T9SS type A sorting domain-containing protein [candidate division Zixibacteria bacterium]NIY29893.1 T9SS type A sorting domain-containing protein [Fodinibius sp.]
MMAKIYGWDSGGLSAPSNCSASTDISDHIHINWTDNADNESGYWIERDGSFLIDLPVNSTSYDDYGVNQGQQYNYTIKVYNEADTTFCDAGTGMLPGEIASPSDCAASAIYCECVRITWTDNANNESGYRLLRDGSVLTSLPANTEAINDYSAIPGQEHLYEVEAYNDHGTGFCSAGTGIRLAPPDQPTLVSPADNADDLALPVTLSWSADGTWYLCQVDNDANFVEPLITSAEYLNSPQMQLTDNMERGKTYYWRVRAYNSCGVSEWSDAFEFSTEYLRMMGTIFSQTDKDTIIHETVELYKYGELDPFKITETYCIATGEKDAGDSITMYRFDSLLQETYSVKFMDFWVYDSIDLEDNYKCDSLNIEWTGMGWTNVEDIESEVLPESYTLFQNYPNPFNPVTRIEFTLPIESYVIIDVLNIKGELVKTLVNQHLSAGHKAVTWNGLNESGSPVSSGIYFYRLVAGGVVSTKKMVLLK